MLALLASGLLGACMTPMPEPLRGPQVSYQPPSVISIDVTMAPTTLGSGVEVGLLQRRTDKPSLLRRAWLELEAGHSEAALDASAEVLFGNEAPSMHEESFARYLRSLAFTRQGHPERGRYDLDRARTLAIDPDLRDRLAPPPTAVASGEPWGSLAVQSRASWHPAAVNRRSLDGMRKPARVTIHHSAMYFRDTQPRACAAQIARIQREHMQSRGYGDIGYHFLIDPSGRIWEGRELQWQGAHASGDNNIANIGICLLGNFVRMREGQGPTTAQVESMEALVVQLMRHYRMPAGALFCHSDFKATECPGPRMTPIVKQLARQLRAPDRHVASAAEDD